MPRNRLRRHRDTVEGDFGARPQQCLQGPFHATAAVSPSQQKSKSHHVAQHPKNYEDINVFMKGIVTHTHRDHVPAMLLGDSRSRQACCQVRFQASLRRCCPSQTPAHECETMGILCRTWAKRAVNCVPWMDVQMEKRALLHTTEIKKKKSSPDGWRDGEKAHYFTQQ